MFSILKNKEKTENIENMFSQCVLKNTKNTKNTKRMALKVKCVFLGYKNGVKGYMLWSLETRKIIVSRDVIFDETAMLRDLPTNDSCDTSQ